MENVIKSLILIQNNLEIHAVSLQYAFFHEHFEDHFCPIIRIISNSTLNVISKPSYQQTTDTCNII